MRQQVLSRVALAIGAHRRPWCFRSSFTGSLDFDLPLEIFLLPQLVRASVYPDCQYNNQRYLKIQYFETNLSSLQHNIEDPAQTNQILAGSCRTFQKVPGRQLRGSDGPRGGCSSCHAVVRIGQSLTHQHQCESCRNISSHGKGSQAAIGVACASTFNIPDQADITATMQESRNNMITTPKGAAGTELPTKMKPLVTVSDKRGLCLPQIAVNQIADYVSRSSDVHIGDSLGH